MTHRRPLMPMPRPPAAKSPALRRGRRLDEAPVAVRRTVLPGGLRVVTEFVPSVRSASVGVWVNVGSRDEGPTVAGAAHFLEHLLFKSTPTRTAVDIAQSVDAVGGELNAFTAKEHTCYYAHVLDDDLELAVDLVSDVVLNGVCASHDVELERDVVLEEIAMRDDDPEDALGDVFLTAMFGDHPVGRPVIGSVDSVSGMTRSQLHSFHVRRYTPRSEWSWRWPAMSIMTRLSAWCASTSGGTWSKAANPPAAAQGHRTADRCAQSAADHP